MPTKEKILIVDDEPSFCRLMERLLEEDGYSCCTACSAADALKLLRTQPFDLLITDIRMPEVDGLELMRQVAGVYPDLAVLVTTGVNDREVALQALELGAFGYLIKPCEAFEVLVHVANSLRLARLEKLSQNYQQELEGQVARRTEELETANRQLEESNRQLLQQEKLASIGQLAAGIAHEIKTPTGFVASNLGSLQKYLQRLTEYRRALQQVVEESATEQQREALKQLARKLKIDLILEDLDELVANCQEGAERIKTIIQGLKDFSRQDSEIEELLDLNQIIEEALLLVWNELKYKAEVVRDLQDLPQLRGYRQRLGQVFVNLLVNAGHAIKEQGRIRVSAGREGAQIVVQIQDNGCGIPAENLEKIFEPFFTTKEIGVGTGLGLSIIKDIIEQHQGTIEVTSTSGQGSCFTLRLPAAGEE